MNEACKGSPQIWDLLFPYPLGGPSSSHTQHLLRPKELPRVKPQAAWFTPPGGFPQGRWFWSRILGPGMVIH